MQTSWMLLMCPMRRVADCVWLACWKMKRRDQLRAVGGVGPGLPESG